MHGKGEDGTKDVVGDAMASGKITVAETGELPLGCKGHNLDFWEECDVAVRIALKAQGNAERGDCCGDCGWNGWQNVGVHVRNARCGEEWQKVGVFELGIRYCPSLTAPSLTRLRSSTTGGALSACSPPIQWARMASRRGGGLRELIPPHGGT